MLLHCIEVVAVQDLKRPPFYGGEMRRNLPVFHSNVAHILTEFQEIQQKKMRINASFHFFYCCANIIN